MKKRILAEFIWLVSIYFVAYLLYFFVPALSRFDEHLVDNFYREDLRYYPSLQSQIFSIYGVLVLLIYLARCLVDKFNSLSPEAILLISVGLQIFILRGILSMYFDFLHILGILPFMTFIDTRDGPYYTMTIVIKILLSTILVYVTFMTWRNQRRVI